MTLPPTEIDLRDLFRSAGDVPASRLLEAKAQGGFSVPIFQAIQGNPDLVNEIVTQILDPHFPESVHQELLDAVGMPWMASAEKPQVRSPNFRPKIIRLYEHRCTVCGFECRLGYSDLELEAAHIKWQKP